MQSVGNNPKSIDCLYRELSAVESGHVACDYNVETAFTTK